MEKKKKISGTIFLTNGTQYLACLAELGNKKRYDLPKGGIDAGETPIEGAKREMWEETGIQLKNDEMTDLGVFKMMPEKDLHVFLVLRNELPSISTMRCRSYYGYTMQDDHEHKFDVNSDKGGHSLPDNTGHSHDVKVLENKTSLTIDDVEILPTQDGHTHEILSLEKEILGYKYLQIDDHEQFGKNLKRILPDIVKKAQTHIEEK